MSSRALITGGAGFIGSHLADALVKRGDEVVLLDCLSPQVHPGSEPPAYLPTGAKLVTADILDEDSFRLAVAGCDVVYHLAAETGTGQSMYEPARYMRTNVEGTALLLEVIQSMPERPRVVLAASRAVYGEGAASCGSCGLVHPATRTTDALSRQQWEPSCPGCGGAVSPRQTREDAPARPASIYGVTKQTQEEMLRVAGDAGACDVWALRFQNVYGERQSLSNPYTGLLAVFTNRLRRGLPCELFEDGECTRDFVHVADVVRALLQASARPAEGYRVVNIGSGEATTVREVAECLGRMIAESGHQGALPTPVVTGSFRSGDIRYATAEIGLAERLLDWRPGVGLEDGLGRFLEWALASSLPEERSQAAMAELRERGLGG